MAKKLKSSSSAQDNTPASFLFGAGGGSKAIDSSLSKLFENSSGPVKAPKYLSNTSAPQDVKRGNKNGDGVRDSLNMADSVNGGIESQSDEDDVEEAATPEEMQIDANIMDAPRQQQRKRKRGDDNDDLEESYMRKVLDEEEKDRERQPAKGAEVSGNQTQTDSEQDDDDGDDISPPVHETLAGTTDADPFEKASRTIFLSNVSTEAITSKAAKKTLLSHLGSLLPSLSKSNVTPKIESIRFRSTAFSSTKRPKRAAFAKQELMDTTTKSTNAYVVYSTVAAARSALQLNGTVVLDRHLRVDSVSNPAPIDHKRCVFVGNLDFVDEEADDEENKRKRKNAPGDVEEGLWRTFCENIPGSDKGRKSADGTATNSVESVRVVRDRLTRVGKGFAYVQFWDENCVEAALLLDGKKFPPLLPRKIRVTRAKKIPKANDRPSLGAGSNPNKTPLRASGSGARDSAANSNLLGRATAAKLRSSNKSRERGNGSEGPERIIFEGHRATGGSGPGFKLKTKSRGAKKSGKPKNRSTRRAKAFRASQKGQ